jgi:hypothetical protein
MRARTISRLPDPPDRPFPVADRARDGEPYENPRLVAIRHLRELVAESRAGLDPHDETVFVLDVRPHEQVWARSVVELTGLFLSEIQSAAGGFCRYRMILEADVRAELGLDRLDAPFLDSDETAGELVDLFEARDLALAEERLDNPTSPLDHAIADARDAQKRMHERTVH